MCEVCVQPWRTDIALRNKSVSIRTIRSRIILAVSGEFNRSKRLQSKRQLHSLDVAACTRLASATKVDEFLDTDRECTYTPLETLSCGVVKERVRGHLGRLFVKAVAGEEEVMSENEKEQLILAIWGDQVPSHRARALSPSFQDDDDDVSSSETECDGCRSSIIYYTNDGSFDIVDPLARRGRSLRVNGFLLQCRWEQNIMLLDLTMALGSRMFEDGSCAGVGEAEDDRVEGWKMREIEWLTWL